MEEEFLPNFIFEFPSEILQRILFFSIISRLKYDEDDSVRGTSRVLNLRLVCKEFDALFQSALFETRLMDDIRPYGTSLARAGTLEYWPLTSKRKEAAHKLWHSYLVYRVLNEVDPNVKRYVEVRNTASAICTENGADFLQTIKNLCWLGLAHQLGNAWPVPHRRILRGPDALTPRPPPLNNNSPDVSLLSAAAYLGCVSLTKRLLEHGNDPTEHDMLFPCPMEAASLAGQVTTLQLCQANIPLRQDKYLYYHPMLEEVPRIKGTFPFAIAGAASRGDMEILNIALCPAFLDGTDDVPAHRGVSFDVLRFAKTWEVFSKLLSSLPPDFLEKKGKYSQPNGSDLLMHFADLGNFEIAKGLLDAGAHTRGHEHQLGMHPLWIAARQGYEDIVDLLLEYGADVNRPTVLYCSTVGAAVRSGNISLVKNLLSKGGHFKEEAPCGALVVENVPMLELLLDHLKAGGNLSMVLIHELIALASERQLFYMFWFVIEYVMVRMGIELVFDDSEAEDL
ncbi:unnamed protein product [Clonostachys byssicola]|uniref:Uncharacterized protein n=1 Tax=Clonostachys byssicola TaxID=160290 RepID=A0A9N9XW55_9HYPO|nr:unnamed protein product [Clonostachys byssicola]